MVSPRLRPVALTLLVLATPAAAAPSRAALRAEVEGYAAAACLTLQEQPLLQDQGHLWATGVMEREGGSLDHWLALANAVGAEAARRPMPVARGDGPVDDSVKPMPLLFCHELVRTPGVRAAVERALRRLAPRRRGG